MSEALIAAIVTAFITGGFSVAAVVVSNRKAAADMDAKLAQQQAVFEATVTAKIEALEDKVTALDKKVDKHNNVIDRTYKLEANDALQDAELKRVNKRLEGLEDGGRD